MRRKLVGHTLYDKNGKLLKVESLDHHSMAVKTLFSKFCHGFGLDIVGNILAHTHDMAKGTEVFEKRVGLRDSGGEEIHFAHNVRGGIFLFEKYGDNPFGHMLAVCDVGQLQIFVQIQFLFLHQLTDALHQRVITLRGI